MFISHCPCLKASLPLISVQWSTSLRPDKVSASAQRLGECFVQRSLQVFIEFLRSLLQRGETLHGHPRSTQGWQKKQIQGICWILGVAPRPCGTRVVPGLSLWNQGEQHRAERGEAQSVSLKGTAQSSHWMPWIREHQKNLSGLGTCCPGCPKSGFYQLWSPWGPAGQPRSIHLLDVIRELMKTKPCCREELGSCGCRPEWLKGCRRGITERWHQQCQCPREPARCLLLLF